jgi:hypothetical protein
MRRVKAVAAIAAVVAAAAVVAVVSSAIVLAPIQSRPVPGTTAMQSKCGKDDRVDQEKTPVQVTITILARAAPQPVIVNPVTEVEVEAAVPMCEIASCRRP